MAGKRLLDAAKIVTAGRHVAKSHFAIRREQWELYTRTSSLAKAVKSQTDRVTVTVGAAIELAKRFNEDAPSWQQGQAQEEARRGAETVKRKAEETVGNAAKEAENLARDTGFYGAADTISQARRTGNDDGSFASLRRREQERKVQAETTLRDALRGKPKEHVELIRDMREGGSTWPDVTAALCSPSRAVQWQPDQVALLQDMRDGGRSWSDIVAFVEEGDAQQEVKPVMKRLSPDEIVEIEETWENTKDWQKVTALLKSKMRTRFPVAVDHVRTLREKGKAWTEIVVTLESGTQDPLPTTAANTQPANRSIYGQDTFNQRPAADTTERPSNVDSSLPEHAEQPPVPAHRDLNQDTFPSPSVSDTLDQLPGDINIDAFHSPRVSRMLGQAGQTAENPYATRQRLPPKPLPEMVKAEEQRKREQASQQVAGQPTQDHEAAKSVPETDTAQHDVETQDLAAAIAKEAAAPSEPEEKQYELHESRVPATRFGRIWQYSGLATSMAFGAVGEGFRRFTGGSPANGGSLLLSEGNIDRLVAKLSRMRGAALKLGQMISFQDSKVLPPTINAVLQRVQDSADYMPASQRDKVLVRNLGADWRDLFSKFEEKPFAAASIGQVHKATLKLNEQEVAVKIQYPGVRDSIDSDLNNLSLLLTASQLLPKGLFLDKTIANARTELGWECDYEREAKACVKFKEELVIDEPDTFTVPTVYTEASGADVLTAEFLHGTAVTKIKDLTQAERDWIGTQVLRLSLRELMEWQFMQTDPNWTNFLYNRETKKLELLDFGASREFPDKFVQPYVELLIAASRNDRDACRDLSIELGYLTGQESKEMLKAHIDSIMVLAEPFVESAPEFYDFEDQTITDRVRTNIGLMLRERLAPPPEETYSLHRKLSGAFLLCARLKSKVPAREMFAKAAEVWRGREKKVILDG
ncbi:uncharacterized protein CLAFUR5_06912 [Fulvia fulva]|uniref:ABC1 atypical kinase-like domain-containing protein n=1 Tax=Passalora fulva TaxID=5499 RepID=A0A9Q8UR05_PASFU|nr:uncharacterized protein CLAFUR5_06912 [Fulvia fulva]KAK4623009.1 hypothetical protein CLAFUR0_06778 [Fulvia fulva]UJO19227.1 hypothetical protein CLAFUR5_06912 [Fulvia fulva]